MKKLFQFDKIVILLLLIAGAIGIQYSCSHAEELTGEPKRVAFISSFHDNHVWTENVRDAMLSEFEQNSYLVSLTNVYLNSKNITSFDERRKILNAYLAPIKKNLDAIIVSDLEAAEQVLDYYDSIPEEVPVIQLSVFDLRQPIPFNNLYRLVADIGIEKSFEVARRMFPDTRKVYVWADKTRTGEFYLEQARRQLAIHESDIEIEYGVEARTAEELLGRVRNLEANSILLFCTWQQGDNKTYYDPRVLYPQIIEQARVPVFSVINNVIDGGFVGGYMLTPDKHGRAAARKTMEVWSQPHSKVQRQEIIAPLAIFNRAAMSRWHVGASMLPDEATVLFDWTYALRKNALMIGWFAAVVAMLSLVIVLLLYFRRQLIQKHLKLSRINANYKLLMSDYQHQHQVLEELSANLDSALEAGGVAAWIYEPEIEMFYTLKGESFAGKGLSMLDNRKRIHPDDMQQQQRLLEELACGERTQVASTFRYLHKDGTYHSYECRMKVRTSLEGVRTITGTQKDVTAELLAEKRQQELIDKLRLAMQTTNMVVWEFNTTTGLFTSYNEPIVDYDDGAQFSINMYYSYFHVDDVQNSEFRRITANLLNGVDSSFSFDMRVRTRYDAEWQYCNVIGVPSELDESGRVVKYFGVRTNNTRMVKYQKKLEEEKERALQADKLKSAFLANMSHEIRTPLNAIIGFSELLHTAETENERNEYINVINQNNELLLRLIGDILDLSKIESGMIDLRVERFDMTQLIEEAAMSLKMRFPLDRVELQTRCPYAHCYVELDKNRMLQVVTNFVTNAIKHTDEGYIRIGYEVVDEGVRVWVEDTGSGIAKEMQMRVFDRFEKLNTFAQGTGLGLAICKAIADVTGGRIGLDSQPGHGSTFWVWAPCQPEIEEA